MKRVFHLVTVRRAVIPVLACVALAACGGSVSNPSGASVSTDCHTDAKEVRAAIEQANADITGLTREGKYEEAGRYFAPDVIQLISGQAPIQGREGWIAAQQAAAQLGEWDLQLEVLEVEVSGDMAVERGRGVQTFNAAESSPIPSMELVGDYIVYWKRVDGQWQIQWDYVVLQQPQPNDTGG